MIRYALLAFSTIPLAAETALYLDLAKGWRQSRNGGPAMFLPNYYDSHWEEIGV